MTEETTKTKDQQPQMSTTEKLAKELKILYANIYTGVVVDYRKGTKDYTFTLYE